MHEGLRRELGVHLRRAPLTNHPDVQPLSLDAILGALPDSPAARQAFEDLVETLRATGTRKPQGSPTDFNTQYRAEIGGETLPQQGLTAPNPAVARCSRTSGMRRAGPISGATTRRWPTCSPAPTACSGSATSSGGAPRRRSLTRRFGRSSWRPEQSAAGERRSADLPALLGRMKSRSIVHATQVCDCLFSDLVFDC